MKLNIHIYMVNRKLLDEITYKVYLRVCGYILWTNISKDKVNVKDNIKIDYCSPKVITSNPSLKENFGSPIFPS